MRSRKEGKPALPPLNLMYIAGTLRANGFTDIKILDVMSEGFFNETPFKKDYIRYGLSPEEIKKRIIEYKPNIVGVSCMCDLRKYHAIEICKLVKEVNNDTITVVGGNPVTTNPKWFLDSDVIDYAVLGEGEQPFLELVKNLNHDKNYKLICNIDGIGYRTFENKYELKPQKEWIKDVDTIPFPAHDLIDLDMYLDIWKKTGYQQYEAKKFSMSMMARGCCNFCEHCPHNVIFPGYRGRSAKNIFDEMKWAYRLGIREMQFHEYNGIVNWKTVEEFCNLMIKSGLSKEMRWGWPIGIWLKVLTRDRLKLMREAGMDYLCLAIESYDQKKLNDIMKGKDVDIRHVDNVIAWGREFGYNLHAFFMLGLEGQTKEDIEATINYAKQLDIDTASFFIAQPLPGTPFWNHCVEKKLFFEGFDTFHLRYGKSNIKVTGITPEELEHYRHLGREEFVKAKGTAYQKIKEGIC